MKCKSCGQEIIGTVKWLELSNGLFYHNPKVSEGIYPFDLRCAVKELDVTIENLKNKIYENQD